MVGGMQRRDYPGAHTNSLIGYFRVLYLINHSNSVEDVNVALRTPENGRHRVRDVILDQERTVQARENILNLDERIDAKGVKVLEIRYRI